MKFALQILALLLVLAISASAQTFTEGDYQLNRKKATAGFEVAELLAGDNITFGWNNTNKTLTITGSASSSGTVTSFAATDSTGIDFTVTNPTTTPTLALSLTSAAVGLSNVENTALSTWTGSTNLTTLGTITTGTWQGSIIAPAYLGTGTSISTKYLRGDGTWQTISSGGTGDVVGPASSVDSEVALFDSTTGKLLKRATGTGPAKLTSGVLSASAINLASEVTGTLPVANGGVDPLVTTADNGVGNGRLGLYDTTLADFKYIDVSANGFEFGSERVTASSFQGDGSLITSLNASNLSSGTVATARLPTVPVASGGTSSTTLTANAVLLGNGTSAFQTVAPTTSGNVLTSNGTTWTSAAPAASGTKTIAVRSPRDNQPPAANFATLDTRNSIVVLDFDGGSTNEEAVFIGVIPEAATLTSGIQVRIKWTASTATTGACRWGAQWEREGTDIDADSFDTATEAHTTTSGTSGIESTTVLTCTAIDSLAAGERYRLKIYRDASDTTNDTMAGDAELLTVELRTAN